jgi:hypothetical protein
VLAAETPRELRMAVDIVAGVGALARVAGVGADGEDFLAGAEEAAGAL